MVKGVYILRIVSVCVCVNNRTSGGAFYRLPITHRTNPAIAGTVIHPHGYHVPPCRLKADIRGSDQSAVHVLPRTLSISSAWRGCGACPPFAYRKTRLILWQCVCARFGRFVSSICWYVWSISTFFYRSTCLQVHDMWYHFLVRYQQMWRVAKLLHTADSFFFVCYLLLILPHITQKHIKKISNHWKKKKGHLYDQPFFVLLCRVFKPW